MAQAAGDSSKALVLVGLGEVLWDCFGDDKRPGGAPANVAFHAHQLGLEGQVCSRVGTDELGDKLLEYLRGNGLDTRYIQVDEHHPTGTVTVHTESADAPSYTIHEGVAWDYLTFSGEWPDLFTGASAVCFGTLAQRTPQNRDTIERCLAAAGDALRIYDVNLRPPHYADEWIRRSMEAAQVVKLNESEVEVLANDLGLPDGGLDAFSAAVQSGFDVETICVTRAERGCFVRRGMEVIDQPGLEVIVKDAVGAGDAFTAGLASGLLMGCPLSHVAALANNLGGLVASRAGAMPELRAEFEALKAELAPVL